MSIHLLYNGTEPLGDIRATIQQLSNASGLGDFWQDSSGTFVTTAVAFASRSYAVVEQTVGNASVQYYGNADLDVLGTHVMTYTGDLIIGYHDNADSQVLLFSEVVSVRNGTVVSLTVAEDRANTPVGEAFVFKMSRRADGVIVANDAVYVSDVDVVEFAFEIESLVPDGIVVSTISNIAVSPTGSLVVTKVGPRDTQAILKTSGAQTAGVTYDVSCDVLTSSAVTLQLNGQIKCIATP